MRVLCAGHVNWDVRLRVDRLPAADDEATVRERSAGPGGSAANVTVALVGLDCKARVLGSVGDDDAGREAADTLRAAGVEPRLRRVDGSTATKYVLVDDSGEVAVLGHDGANEAVGPGDIDPVLFDDVDRVHLTGQRPETARRLAELATERDLPVSFDPGRRVADRGFEDVIERTDLLFCNEREAEAVDPPTDATLVTKLGTRGARLDSPDGSIVHEGFPLPARDATGAGDAFAAGFLAALGHGSDEERVLAVANACGALAAAREGSHVHVSWTDVETVLKGNHDGA